MFTDLFWALYWIDVLSSLGRNLIVLLFIGVPFVWFITMLSAGRFELKEKTGHRCAIATSVTALLVGMVTNFIPDKNTMYMMLGVRTTDNIVNSETGKKLQELLNKQIDSYLEKFSK